jgi:DNA-directed RNA polymerase subunit RPC12/RpoP
MKLHKLTCPNCNGSLNIEIAEDTTSVFCPYCGQKFFLDEEKQEYTINKNININRTYYKRYTNDADVIRAKNEGNKGSREFKQVLIIFGILLLIPVLIFTGLSFNEKANRSQGKIGAGFYRDLVGEDYKAVEAHFQAAGFTNIELIDLDDAGIAFWTEGEVETISIGGVTDFDSTDWFDPNTKVVISYH